jgi:hypothetical protein
MGQWDMSHGHKSTCHMGQEAAAGQRKVAVSVMALKILPLPLRGADGVLPSFWLLLSYATNNAGLVCDNTLRSPPQCCHCNKWGSQDRRQVDCSLVSWTTTAQLECCRSGWAGFCWPNEAWHVVQGADNACHCPLSCSTGEVHPQPLLGHGHRCRNMHTDAGSWRPVLSRKSVCTGELIHAAVPEERYIAMCAQHAH